jgi:sulfotransferase
MTPQKKVAKKRAVKTAGKRSSTDSKTLIFNTSMPRAGSELLQVLLHQNPTIYATSTSPLLEYLFAAEKNKETLEGLAMDPKLRMSTLRAGQAAFIEAYLDKLTDRPVIVDKNRGWMFHSVWVDTISGKRKMIGMVRNLKGILTSFEKTFRENPLSSSGPLNAAQLRGITVGQRIKAWVETTPIGLSLLQLQNAIADRTVEDVFFVRYEDLCAKPDDVFKELYEYLELPYFQHYYKGIKKEVYETPGVFGPYGSHEVKLDLKAPPFNESEEIIGAEACRWLAQEFEWYYKTFGYTG